MKPGRETVWRRTVLTANTVQRERRRQAIWCDKLHELGGLCSLMTVGGGSDDIAEIAKYCSENFDKILSRAIFSSIEEKPAALIHERSSGESEAKIHMWRSIRPFNEELL